jgi:hypothetical protein
MFCLYDPSGTITTSGVKLANYSNFEITGKVSDQPSIAQGCWLTGINTKSG